jgi:hypothetical protein
MTSTARGRRVPSALAGLLAALALAVGAARADEGAACGAKLAAVSTSQRAPLATFAREVGLTHVDAFVGTVVTLRRTGRLPDCYLTKRAAEIQAQVIARGLLERRN